MVVMVMEAVMVMEVLCSGDADVVILMEVMCSCILRRSPITPPNSSTHTRSNANVRADRPAPTRHPFHAFNQLMKINAEPVLLYIMYLNSA